MARSDEQIKQDVVNQLLWDDRVDASEVTVEVRDGVVTLQGILPTYFARSCAQDDAWAVAGVAGMKNQTTIRHRPAAWLPSDDELRSAVEERLALDPDIDIADTSVQVVGGIVTVEGSVDAYWKKRHLEDVIASMRGVVDIENKLAVVPTKDVADQEIATDITAALERDLLVDPEEVNVSISEGVVTLSGTVPNGATRTAAERAARNTLGVRDVRNEMVKRV